MGWLEAVGRFCFSTGGTGGHQDWRYAGREDFVRHPVRVDGQSASEWETMRGRHHLADDQIRALWQWTRAMNDSYNT